MKAHTHGGTRTHTYTPAQTHTHTKGHPQTEKDIHACTHAHACVYTHTHTHTHHTHHAQTHTHTHTSYTHPHKRTHTQNTIQPSGPSAKEWVSVFRIEFKFSFNVRTTCLHCFTSTVTIRTVRDREPRTATLTFTQLLNSESRMIYAL